MSMISRIFFLIALVMSLAGLSQKAAAQPAFSKVFSPNSIGIGATTTLTFTIDGSGVGMPMDDLAFTDVLPSGMTVSGLSASHSCGPGILSAADGASTIALTGGQLAPGATCTITATVTTSSMPPSGTPIVLTNTTGDLTSSAGNSGTATDDLTVTGDVPAFSKSISPNPTNVNDVFRVTYLIDNTANTSNAATLSVIEEFPAGVTIASPSNLATTCGNAALPPNLRVTNTGNGISLFANGFNPSFPALAAGASCTITVDLQASSFGSFTLTSGNLLASNVSAGTSTATVMVNAPSSTEPTLYKRFVPTSSGPGATVQLTFELVNTTRFDATNITFSDDLDAFLTGATASNLPTAPCGAGSSLSGTSTLTLTGGNVTTGGSCVFTVDVTIPTSATAATYTNTTSALSATVDGATVVGAVATDTLEITAGTPLDVDFSFVTNPAQAGGTVDILYRITNPGGTATATDMNLSHTFSGMGLVSLVSGPTTTGSCSSVTANFTNGFNPSAPCSPCDGIPASFTLSDGDITPGGICEIALTVQLEDTLPGGSYGTETGTINATSGGATVTGNTGSDSLSVNSNVNLDFTKAFSDNTINEGATTTLSFTISSAAESTATVTGLTFTDDLNAMLAGTTATGLPLSNVCGTGSSLTGSAGDTLLTLAGASIAPDTSCTFSVTVQAPTGVGTTQNVTNTTSDLTGVVGSVPVSAPAATADLTVYAPNSQPLVVTKEFTDDPILPGGTANLEFTITNPNTGAGADATSITLTDSISSMVSGATVTSGTGTNLCGTGSVLTGTTFLIMAGGSLAPGASCTFSVGVTIPVSATGPSYANTTGTPTATISGATVVSDPATDNLLVSSEPLLVTKTMSPSPVNAGGATTLTIAIENPSSSAMTALQFTDALQSMVSGASVVSTSTNDCLGTPTFPGNNISYTGGSLAAGATCTVAFSVLIPAATGTGTYDNTVTGVSAVATTGGATITGNDSTAQLSVVGTSDVTFTKAFGATNVVAGEDTTLSFTLTNGAGAISNLRFSDDVTASIPGATISGLPATPCGAGSTIANAGGVLTLSGMSLAATGDPAATCTFGVTVSVPASATPGAVTNTTSVLSGASGTISTPASASITIDPRQADLTMSIADATDPILPGGSQTYTVQVNNAGPQEAENVVSTFTLPAGMTLVSTSGCAEDPAGAPTCSLGTIAASGNDSYTVTATVSATAVGSLSATGSVTSSTVDPNAGNNSASESTTVTPVADLSITKTESVASVNAGGNFSYTIVASNAGPATDPSVSVADTIPAGLTCGYTSAASGGATGNIASGTGNLAETLSMPSGSSVTYNLICSVDFSFSGASVSNTATITASILDTVSGNNSATETTTVTPAPSVSFSKSFANASVAQGETVDLTFSISNTSTTALTGITFSDNVAAALTGATFTGVPATPCGAGSSLATAGGNLQLNGGNLAAGDFCVFGVTVNVPLTVSLGAKTNTTSVLSYVAGIISNPATASITVVEPTADLSVTLADNVDPVQAGGTLTYTVNVANAGPQDALATTATFTPPADFTVTSTSGCAEDPTGSPSCTLGTIASGGSASYTITGTIAGTATAQQSASVAVTNSLTDPNATNNTATETTDVTPVVDLAVTKSDGVSTTIGGDTLTYTIVATNNGPSLEAAATLTDVIQPDMTCGYTSVAAGGASGNTASGSGNLSETLNMPASSSVTYTMTCVVDFTYTGVITNSVTIGGPVLDTVPGNNTAIDTTTITTAPAPTFTKSFAPTSVVQGFDTVMSFAITNNASVPLNGLTFTDNIDGWIAGTTLGTLPTDPCGTGSTLTASGGVLTLAGGVLTASGGASDSCSFNVTVTIPTTAPLGDAINTTSNLSNGTVDVVSPASATLTVTAPMADLSVAVSDDVDPVLPGGTLVYTIDVANAGPQDATSVSSAFTLPANVTFVSSSGCAEDPSANPTCSLGTIASGSSASYTVTGTVSTTAVGALSASATVSSPVADPSAANNTATEGTSVTAVVDVSVTKTDGVTAITAGDTLTYTIAAANAGPAADPAMALADTLPPELTCTYTSVAAGGVTGNTASGTGNLAETLSMPSGGSATYTFSCLVDIAFTGTVSNTASATPSILDSDPSNNSATDNDTVVSAPAPLVWSHSFNPSTIDQGTTSVLTFLIDNTANAIGASSLAFSNSFPAGMRVASAPAASNTCGATFSPSANDTTISMSGGTVAAGSTCSATVTVQAINSGNLDNTSGTLSSNFPTTTPGTTERLVVNSVPLVTSMLFTPASIEQFETSTLIYRLSNPAVIDATSIALTDTLPSGVTIASPLAVTSDCTGGAITAVAGGTSFAYSGGTLGAGNRCSLSVNVTSALVDTYANALESVTANTGTSAVANATLEVTSATTAQVSFVQESDTDGSYVFTATEAALNFQIEVSAGSGSAGPFTVQAGTYVVTASPPTGVALTAISCNDSNSTGDPTSRTVTLNLAVLETVTCTLSAQSSVQKTVDTINRFLTKRADLILSTEPSMGRRIDRLNRGFGNASPLTFSNGDLKSFLPFTADISRGSNDYRFSTSLLQVRQAAASVELAHGSTKDVAYVENYRFDAWFEAQYKEFDSGAQGEGHFAVAHFGVDYLLNKNVLIGVMAQFDDMSDNSTALNSSASGTGWMVGPYITARIAPRLYFDARIAGGASSNTVSPFNTYTDSFDTERWLAVASLSGEFDKGPWTIRPNASLAYFEETQESYVDSVGATIPSQTVQLGQLQLGPTFTGHFEGDNGETYAPYFSIDAIYNLGSTSGVTVTNPSTPSTEGWRARLKAGINMTDENGISIGFGGTYDGIGRDDFEAWGLNFDLTIPLKKAKAR